MSTMARTRGWRLGRSAVIVLAVLAAALLDAYALRFAGSPPPLVWSSLLAAVPVSLLVGVAAVRWPHTATLGLTGLVAFGATSAVQVSLGENYNPLPIALGAVLAVGAITVMLGRARWRDVLGGLLLAYAAAALLFYVSLVR